MATAKRFLVETLSSLYGGHFPCSHFPARLSCKYPAISRAETDLGVCLPVICGTGSFHAAICNLTCIDTAPVSVDTGSGLPP